MNTVTVRAVMVGVLIAVWAWAADVARLHVSLWAGVIALGCYFAAGGGTSGLQKTVVAALSGVLWVLLAHAARAAIGGGGGAPPPCPGAPARPPALQPPFPVLPFT